MALNWKSQHFVQFGLYWWISNAELFLLSQVWPHTADKSYKNWHKHLGHRAHSKIDVLSNFTLKDKKPNKTNVCHISKQKHLPFKSQQNMCNASF